MKDIEMRTLASSMSARDVIIFTQPDCVYCEMAKRWLDEHGFAYTECDIASDPESAAAYKRYLAIGTPYVVIKRIGRERHLRNGFTGAAFLAALS
jgi:glutaredoxin